MSIPTDFFCADLARQSGEPLEPAPHIARWLLVEVHGAWAGKILQTESLPAAVRDFLAGWEAAEPNARIGFIRQPGRRAEDDGDLRVFAAQLGNQPRLVGFTIPHLEALPALPIDAALAGDDAPGAEAVTRALALVCAHGKRDRCCARDGVPVYEAGSTYDALETWQTSHVGGHRFAANVVTLPQGAYYGYITPDDVPQLVRAIHEDRLLLGQLRGRAGFPEFVQFAERALREELGLDAVDALQVQAVTTGETHAAETFAVELTVNEARYTVNVNTQPSTEPIHKSCTAAKPEIITRFVVQSITPPVAAR